METGQIITGYSQDYPVYAMPRLNIYHQTSKLNKHETEQ